MNISPYTSIVNCLVKFGLNESLLNIRMSASFIGFEVRYVKTMSSEVIDKSGVDGSAIVLQKYEKVYAEDGSSAQTAQIINKNTTNYVVVVNVSNFIDRDLNNGYLISKEIYEAIRLEEMNNTFKYVTSIFIEGSSRSLPLPLLNLSNTITNTSSFRVNSTKINTTDQQLINKMAVDMASEIDKSVLSMVSNGGDLLINDSGILRWGKNPDNLSSPENSLIDLLSALQAGLITTEQVKEILSKNNESNPQQKSGIGELGNRKLTIDE